VEIVECAGGYWPALYYHDWFHTLLDSPLPRMLLLLSGLYIAVVMVYAMLYLYFADDCGMDITTPMEVSRTHSQSRTREPFVVI